ncbi:hypothetical protein C0216_27815 [Streptomyces globosus]|uniref:Uncharacterized protein n=1 Tax=Streptomyces globosus TaxID=68209 RepID=A0A344U765_9ACTN|nr:hypothetical protein [Streptomyces globosus]AXE26736.1 hypothetical protein C0216_27815 [Streptomyces globosus]
MREPEAAVRRRLSARRAAGGLLALLLLGAVVPEVAERAGAAGSPAGDAGCRSVAFMSMTGVAPACR